MTDELQNLVAELRHPRQRNERYYEPLCARAADEIERLAALAQSDAEAVAWPTDKQVQDACEAYNAECWRTTNHGFKPYEHLMEAALKAITPPRPDASAEPKVTLDEIEVTMDRVLERRGLKAQVDNLERRSAW